MGTILELKKQIAEYDDLVVGCAQVLGKDWEYEILPDGTVPIIKYVGPATQRQDWDGNPVS